MAPRREARERALSLGYEAEQRGVDLDDLLSDLPAEPEPYARELAEGVARCQPEIDALLREFSQRWTPERMPVIDRGLLRLGTFELLHCPDVPTPVVISEAVALAKEYSTEDSGRFVNGLLSRIAAETRGGVTVCAETVCAETVGAETVTPERLEPPLEVPVPDEIDPDKEVVPDKPWIVIVWNDPVNLMSYVVWVLRKLFGYSKDKATKLMMDVHTKGRAVVSHGTREKAETDVARLHAHGLWATMQRDS